MIWSRFPHLKSSIVFCCARLAAGPNSRPSGVDVSPVVPRDFVGFRVPVHMHHVAVLGVKARDHVSLNGVPNSCGRKVNTVEQRWNFLVVLDSVSGNSIPAIAMRAIIYQSNTHPAGFLAAVALRVASPRVYDNVV